MNGGRRAVRLELLHATDSRLIRARWTILKGGPFKAYHFIRHPGGRRGHDLTSIGKIRRWPAAGCSIGMSPSRAWRTLRLREVRA